MKKQLLIILMVSSFAISLNGQVLYSEKFSGLTLTAGASLVPAGMIEMNVDGFPANSAGGNSPFNNGAYTKKGWAVYSDGTDTFALSTSYRTPVGAVDRWLITPPITGITNNTFLSWKSMAENPNGGCGYEVYVSAAAGANATPTVADFTGVVANKVFSIAGEANSFTTHSLNLAAFAGQTVRLAFRNNSNNKYRLFLDNINVVTPAANDIAIDSVGPQGIFVWGTVGATKTISGKIRNNGYTPITSFTAKFNGSVVISQTFTGLNLNYGQTYSFTFTTPYTITAVGQNFIKVWAELTGDANHANDTLYSQGNGYANKPSRKIVFEEGTGTWCGACVRGTVYMDSIAKQYPNTVIPIAVHNQDPMTDLVYDSGVSKVILGYPSVLVDRSKMISDPMFVFQFYTMHFGDFGFADISLTPSYNTSTRVATVSVDTKPYVGLINNTVNTDYRIAVVFTENEVRGTTADYNQKNYYAGGALGAMAGAGHNFATEPNPVLAANMKYDFVARTIVGGFSGKPNSLPNTLVAGTTYNSSFTYTIPAGYNPDNMQVSAILIDAKANIIYNANRANLTTFFGINSLDASKQDFVLYPNPASNSVNLSVNLLSSENVYITVYNAIGEIVYAENRSNLNAGENMISLNTTNFANGIYSVSLSTKQGAVTKKLVINQ